MRASQGPDESHDVSLARREIHLAMASFRPENCCSSITSKRYGDFHMFTKAWVAIVATLALGACVTEETDWHTKTVQRGNEPPVVVESSTTTTRSDGLPMRP